MAVAYGHFYSVLFCIRQNAEFIFLHEFQKKRNKAEQDVEAVIFQPLPLPLMKKEKTTVDNFF